MPKLTNSYTHLGSSDACKIAYGSNRFGHTNEDQRISLVNETVGEGQNFGSQMAKDRGDVLEPALAQWTLSELQKLSDTKIKVLDNTKADLHDEYKIASSCDLKLFLPEPIDVKCPVSDNIITMSGVVPVEIKTDGYNKGEPHKDFEAQLRHQMICLFNFFRQKIVWNVLCPQFPTDPPNQRIWSSRPSSWGHVPSIVTSTFQARCLTFTSSSCRFC